MIFRFGGHAPTSLFIHSSLSFYLLVFHPPSPSIAVYRWLRSSAVLETIPPPPYVYPCTCTHLFFHFYPHCFGILDPCSRIALLFILPFPLPSQPVLGVSLGAPDRRSWMTLRSVSFPAFRKSLPSIRHSLVLLSRAFCGLNHWCGGGLAASRPFEVGRF